MEGGSLSGGEFVVDSLDVVFEFLAHNPEAIRDKLGPIPNARDIGKNVVASTIV